MKLNDKLIYLRRKQGWTQNELAERMDVSRQTVSKWEQGIADPSLENLRSLSALYGVSTGWLLDASAAACCSEMPTEQQGEKKGRTNKYRIIAIVLLILVTAAVGLWAIKRAREPQLQWDVLDKADEGASFEIEW